MKRPTYRKGFHVRGQRRPPKMYVERAWPGHWAWHCFLCEPPCSGSTKSFERTLKNALAHLKHRSTHHSWAANRRWQAHNDFMEECGR